jgi:hypothetical protein
LRINKKTNNVTAGVNERKKLIKRSGWSGMGLKTIEVVVYSLTQKWVGVLFSVLNMSDMVEEG